MIPTARFVEVTKKYGRVTANEQVSFSILPGEVHALVGENGAGKSTLMGILSGFVRPDAGTVLIDEAPVRDATPATMLRHGVGLCAQHFHQVPTLTGYENIALGRAGKRGLFGSLRGDRKRIRELMQRYRLDVELDVPVDDLSLGERERVEILGLLYRDSRILILDEPTAVLAASEVESLLQTMRTLAAEGRSIIFVSHKLPEVLAVADRVTVLRGGRVVETLPRRDVDTERLVRLIVGGSPPRPAQWSAQVPGREVLAVRDATLGRLDGLSLTVSEGQIVGVGGVEGNGQKELASALLGYEPLVSGEIRFMGEPVKRDVRKFRRSIGVIPEDRHREGLILGRSLVENGALGRHDRSPFSSAGVLRWDKMRAHAAEIIDVYGVRPGDATLPARSFSGGNQQRFIAGRELSQRPPLLLAVHPTRGVDLGAVQFLHGRLLEERARGAAILLITADLSELEAVCDRIHILYRGRSFYEAARNEIDTDGMQSALLGLGPSESRR